MFANRIVDVDRLKSLELYRSLTDLGEFYSTSFSVDSSQFMQELATCEHEWCPYNPKKEGYKRWGLSLTSLDGGTSGVPDLDSISEYNRLNGTSFNESSFQKTTPIWDHFASLNKPLEELGPFLGRTHLIKFGECGGFPPHRDLGQSFRLISFLSGTSDSLQLILEDRKILFQNGPLYFMDTRRIHSIFNFCQESIILVMNITLSLDSISLIHSRLKII